MVDEKLPGGRYPGPERPYPKTHAEVLAKYHALGLIDEPGDSPAGSPLAVNAMANEDNARPCRDCGRSIFWASRWNGERMPLNADPKPGELQTRIETAMGHFEPIFRHECPGKYEEWLKARERERFRLGLDLDLKLRRPPKKGQLTLL